MLAALAASATTWWTVRRISGPPCRHVNMLGVASPCSRFQARNARSSGPHSGTGRDRGDLAEA